MGVSTSGEGEVYPSRRPTRKYSESPLGFGTACPGIFFLPGQAAINILAIVQSGMNCSEDTCRSAPRELRFDQIVDQRADRDVIEPIDDFVEEAADE